MLSGAPREGSACGFLGDLACSEPSGPQMTQPFSPDPRFYQEVRERGLNTSHESDDDLLDEPSGPEGAQKVGGPIVVRSYRPPQVTWSRLPEVGPGWGRQRGGTSSPPAGPAASPGPPSGGPCLYPACCGLPFLVPSELPALQGRLGVLPRGESS